MSNSIKRHWNHLSDDDYQVGWICALPIELAAAQEMLDDTHDDELQGRSSLASYTLGRIGEHNVVVTYLAAGQYGTASAAVAAGQMTARFTSIQLILLVGVGGGVPSSDFDVRLGDVVVSQPHLQHGGVVQYDMGKADVDGRMMRTGSLNSPPTKVLQAIAKIRANHYRGRGSFHRFVSVFDKLPYFSRVAAGLDVLFEADYQHDGGPTCANCHQTRAVCRPLRGPEEQVQIHYGTIGSGNQVIKDGLTRDKLCKDLGGGVLCFEMEAAGLMNNFPCLVIRGICDYSDSHKNKSWQPFAAATAASFGKEVLSVVAATKGSRTMATSQPNDTKVETESRQASPDATDVSMSLGHELETRNKGTQEQEMKKVSLLMESLKFAEMETRHDSIVTAHDQTCEWLLTRFEFMEWLNSRYSNVNESSNLLWIKGKPGMGKSTLMKLATEHVTRTVNDCIITSFFFNARGAKIERSTVGMYRALLHQILSKLPKEILVSIAVAVSTSAHAHQWDISSLQRLARRVIKHLDQKVVWFIDALDECDEDEVRDMITFIGEMRQIAVSVGSKFLICLSSRHYPHISIIGKQIVLEELEEHKIDIQTYVRSVLRVGQGKLAETIKAEILDRSSGVFLWVVLAVSILQREYDRGNVKGLAKRLEQIPSGLFQLFKDTLSRDNENFDQMILCLQWVLYSKRPLSCEELYYAILASDAAEVGPWDPEEISRSDMENYVLNSSKGFVEITEATQSGTTTVQFIHESVREFLLKYDGFQKRLSLTWEGVDMPVAGHQSLKACCENYLNLEISKYMSIPAPLPGHTYLQWTQIEELSSKMTRFPFLKYSLEGVLYHADQLESLGVTQRVFLTAFPVVRWSMQHGLFQRAKFQPSRPTTRGLLDIITYYECPSLIRLLLSLDSGGTFDSDSVLGDAIYSGNKQVLQELTQSIASNQQVYQNLCMSLNKCLPLLMSSTPLGWAARKGYEAIINILLSLPDIQPDAPSTMKERPLGIAIRAGREGVVTALLAANTDVNTGDGYSCIRPLSCAVAGRHHGIVKLLLGHPQLDVNAQSNELEAVLHLVRNDKKLIDLLLSQPLIETNVKDNGNRTPLLKAIRSGHNDTATALLAHPQTDPNLGNSDEGTPLHSAIRKNNIEAVRLLIQHPKTNVNSRNKCNHTPLIQASYLAREEVLCLLLKHPRIDVNASTEPHMTNLPSLAGSSLSWAAQNRSLGCMKLLLCHPDIDVNLHGPLIWASMNGHEDVVELLLARSDIEINIKDGNGETPVALAREYGWTTVQSMLETKAKQMEGES